MKALSLILVFFVIMGISTFIVFGFYSFFSLPTPKVDDVLGVVTLITMVFTAAAMYAYDYIYNAKKE